MKPVQSNRLRIVLALVIFTLGIGLIGPLGRAGRSEGVTSASPVTPAQVRPAQPSASRTFRNLQPIPIPDSGPASPYPSIINVSGINGVVGGVTLILNSVTHPNPDDLDLMLESPSGRRIIIWSDAGGSFAMNNQSIGFADNGVILPDGGPIITSPYKPVNYAGGDPDNFPAPAPPPPHGDPARGETFGIAFSGENPTGPWKLYVVDDTAGNSGTIGGGWSLTVGTLEHVVTSLGDSGPGTLREVATNAPNGAVITFDASLVGGTITLTSGVIVIADKSLTIAGPGAEKLTISGNNASRVFNIQGDPLLNTVSISGLTIANGNTGGVLGGGGILNDATLTIGEVNFINNRAISGGAISVIGDGRLSASNCTFTNNIASSSGGGTAIESTNPVPSDINGCTFAGNDAGVGGGGLSITFTSAETTVSNSTFVGNTSDIGGGLSIVSSNATVTNCTFSGNQADFQGGGINNVSGSTLTLKNSTITLNTAGQAGGGLFVGNNSDVANSLNTVYAQNSAPTGPNISGQVNSQGGNFVSNNSGATITPQPLDQIGTPGNPINPQLTPLNNYGGPVRTHAAFFFSPLINAANPSGAPLTDARDRFRINPDIGAFEFFPREDSSLSLINLGFRNGNSLFVKLRLTAANQEATPLNDQRVTVRITNVRANATTDFNGEAILRVDNIAPSPARQTLSGEYTGSVFHKPSRLPFFKYVRNPFNTTPERAHEGGGGCQFLIFDADASFAANGGSGTINVRTFPFDCNWTAVSNDPWIQITSGNNGSGDGSVTYTVSSHTGTSPRAGSITVAGITYDVLQGVAFTDVPVSHPFYTQIGKLSARSVTLGCNTGLYCPDDVVTRQQMAAFIIRALGDFNPPQPAMQRFLDVPPSNPFYAFIEQMAVRQITLGCGGGNYCPADPVLRDQMAAFLIRALGEPNPAVPFEQRFVDVAVTSLFAGFIEEMAIRRITLGCSANQYCPSDSVTRGQMAAFLVRAFGL